MGRGGRTKRGAASSSWYYSGKLGLGVENLRFTCDSNGSAGESYSIKKTSLRRVESPRDLPSAAAAARRRSKHRRVRKSKPIESMTAVGESAAVKAAGSGNIPSRSDTATTAVALGSGSSTVVGVVSTDAARPVLAAASITANTTTTNNTIDGVPSCVVSTRITVYRNDSVHLPTSSTIHHVGMLMPIKLYKHSLTLLIANFVYTYIYAK